MKVLILYPWIHHERMVKELSCKLTSNGIITDAICLNDYEVINNSNNKTISFFCKTGRTLRRLSKNYNTERFDDIFEWHIVTLLFRQYDIIDFHAYYNSYYFKMINACIDHKIKYDVTLWGSDVLRATEKEFRSKEYGFRHARHIKGLPNLLNAVSIAYNGKYDPKAKEMLFGNVNIDNIDLYPIDVYNKEASELIGNNHKIVICVGYNGISAQQHHLILHAIDKLPVEYKDKIHVVVPITYGASNMYIEEINESLSKMGVSSKMLTSFLSVKQLALLRQIPHIVINAQTSDAFCGALQEHLYCGNVVMIADWLCYTLYDRNDVFYIKFSENELTQKIIHVIDCYDYLKLKTANNKMKIRSIVSWDKAILICKQAYL